MMSNTWIEFLLHMLKIINLFKLEHKIACIITLNTIISLFSHIVARTLIYCNPITCSHEIPLYILVEGSNPHTWMCPVFILIPFVSYSNFHPLFVSPSLSFSVHSQYISTDSQRIVGGVLVGTGLWVTIIMIMRNVLKCLLSWHGWMYARHGSVSWSTRLWMVRKSIRFLFNSLKELIHSGTSLWYSSLYEWRLQCAVNAPNSLRHCLNLWEPNVSDTRDGTNIYLTL